MLPHHPVEVHYQVVVFLALFHDRVALFQEHSETDEEQEGIAVAELLGRREACRFPDIVVDVVCVARSASAKSVAAVESDVSSSNAVIDYVDVSVCRKFVAVRIFGEFARP